MKERLRQHIINRLGGNIDGIDEVLSQFKSIKVKRNEQILTQGDICRYVYFVAKGCLQVYVYDKNSNETTRDIVTEDNWCSELMSFGNEQPSSENIRAVEHSDLCAIDRVSFMNMMERFLNLA
ncbi:MAG: cyclic nucleotide-binding domain-containing protein [Bacteroidia bacterium]